MTVRATATATALTGAVAAALLALAPQAQAAAPQPPGAPAAVPAAVPASAESLAAARAAAAAPATLSTLSRFFSREGKLSAAAAEPRVEGGTLAVHYLSPEFVAGRAGAPVARVEFLASKAVAADGQLASLWTAPVGGAWQVVNIATGDDEFRYAAAGARALPGGLVFREPQIDAWYVAKGAKVLPLDPDAVRAVGARGTTLAAYGARVRAAYGAKLPGSAYARSGQAGGYAAAASPRADGHAAARSAGAGGDVAARSAGAGVHEAVRSAGAGRDVAVPAAGGLAGAAALAAVWLVRRRRIA
ncbi:hypothetical protein ACIQUQ_08335 [Streptomyces sp. NPDC101118]|uniref:hypothetical protein n=1 Tax=Streptomyces sp. NPDC101118 TaxID=3366109 RepID=UPI0037FFF14B